MRISLPSQPATPVSDRWRVRRASANLLRAFLFAGAKSVVASLWTANDPATRSQMERLYRYIADGEDKGSALRHAQIDLVREFGDQAVPFYWAGFIMVGDGSGKIRVSANRASKPVSGRVQDRYNLSVPSVLFRHLALPTVPHNQ